MVPPAGEAASEGSVRIRLAERESAVATQIEALLAALEGEADQRVRATLLLEVALRLRDGLGDEAQALDALFEAWREDPRNDEVIDALEALARRAGRWAEILESARGAAAAEREPSRSLAYAESMVRWLTREVDQADLARQWLERIRALDSTHWQLHMLQAAISREHGDLRRELDELDLAVLSARRADDRARIHLMMAARYGEPRTRNVAQAKKHYEAAHRLFPKDIAALRGLEEIARQGGDAAALAEVLRLQAETDESAAVRAPILVALARIEEAEFRKPELAARSLERAIALEPGNATALEALERVYAASRAWRELVALLEHAAVAASDAQVRAGRIQRLGAVLESKLGDARAAVETYDRLAVALPDDETVLGELARLHEKLGDVPAAVRARDRMAELASSPQVRARMHVIAGQLLVPIDPNGARLRFERAVSADPSNGSGWTALLWDARAANDGGRLERYLDQRAKGTETPRARAAAFVELADARAKGGDAAGARRAFEEAVAADPTNEAAAVALVLTMVDEGRFGDALPLFEVAIAAAERDKDYDRLVALRRAEARAASAEGMPDRALASSHAAYDARASVVEVREELIASALSMRADPQIASVRAALLDIADRPEGLSIEARASLADVLAATGDADRAAALYDGVLAESPDNDRALAGLAEHHTSSGNRAAALGLERRLAEAIEPPDDRFVALCEVADALAAKAGDLEQAAEIYEEARRLRPRDLPVLHKLLALYPQLGRWASLFEVLRGIADADVDPARRAKTFFTMAQLAKEELADRSTALSLFEKALDVDPSHLVAFENIVRILTEDRDWLGLEQMYKRMIARALTGQGERAVTLQHALYKQIGLVYRDRLGQPTQALEAFRVAAHLRPSDEEGQAILRELLARTGHGDGAVAITLERVLRAPLEPTSYAALFDLLLAQGQRDRALVVASSMRFLGIAHPAAEGLRASYPQPPIEGIVLDLGEGGYRRLLHEQLDPAVTEIFEVVGPALVDLLVARLSLRDRLGNPGPPLKDHDWLGRSVARASAIFGVPSPRLFQRTTPGPGLTVVAARPAALLVHPPAFGGIAPEVVAFLVGKRVVETTPPLLARALCPSITELKQLAQSAARIATNQAEPDDGPLRERLRREDVVRIAAAVEAQMRTTGKLDVLRWSQRAEVSAARAGLLLAGDLDAARAAIALEAQAPGDLAPREKMRELTGWFLGDVSASLRRALGVALA